MAKKFLFDALPVAALLALGTVAILSVARNAPAFSEKLRTASVLGDWRVAQGDALFDKSDYYFQLGYGFLQADTASLIMGADALPSLDVFDAQMDRSAELLRASLLHAPGRVDAWTSLAWASFLKDEPRAAESALRVSWSLAPFNVSEASDRIALSSALDDFQGAGWRDDPPAKQAIENDLMVIETFDPGYFGAFPEDLETIFE